MLITPGMISLSRPAQPRNMFAKCRQTRAVKTINSLHEDTVQQPAGAKAAHIPFSSTVMPVVRSTSDYDQKLSKSIVFLSRLAWLVYRVMCHP